jgi:hypothetical protein
MCGVCGVWGVWVVWAVWGCGVTPCARTFQGLHSVRLWTPTIYIFSIFRRQISTFIKDCSKFSWRIFKYTKYKKYILSKQGRSIAHFVNNSQLIFSFQKNMSQSEGGATCHSLVNETSARRFFKRKGCLSEILNLPYF